MAAAVEHIVVATRIAAEELSQFHTYLNLGCAWLGELHHSFRQHQKCRLSGSASFVCLSLCINLYVGLSEGADEQKIVVPSCC